MNPALILAGFFLLIFVITMFIMYRAYKTQTKELIHHFLSPLLGLVTENEINLTSIIAEQKGIVQQREGQAVSIEAVRPKYRNMSVYVSFKEALLKNFTSIKVTQIVRNGWMYIEVWEALYMGKKLTLILNLETIHTSVIDPEDLKRLPVTHTFLEYDPGSSTSVTKTIKVNNITILYPINFDLKKKFVEMAFSESQFRLRESIVTRGHRVHTLVYNNKHQTWDTKKFILPEDSYFNTPTLLDNSYLNVDFTIDGKKYSVPMSKAIKLIAKTLFEGGNVAMLGAPNTGKSSLTAIVAQILLEEYDVEIVFVPVFKEDLAASFAEHVLSSEVATVYILDDFGGQLSLRQDESAVQTMLKSLLDSPMARATTSRFSFFLTGNLEVGDKVPPGLLREGRFTFVNYAGEISWQMAINMASEIYEITYDKEPSRKFDLTSFTLFVKEQQELGVESIVSSMVWDFYRIPAHEQLKLMDLLEFIEDDLHVEGTKVSGEKPVVTSNILEPPIIPAEKGKTPVRLRAGFRKGKNK